MKTIRVLIADDHAIVLQSVGYLLRQQADFEIVGLATSGEEAQKLAATLKPDVVVMDVSMPGIGGAVATKRILEHGPHIKVLAFSGHQDQAHVSSMIAAGAVGYVTKHTASKEMAQAIRDVVAGTKQFVGASAPQAQLSLSVNEIQILQMSVRKIGNREIGEILGLTTKSIETYKTRIGKKLGLKSRAEWVQYALLQGWLDGAC